MEIIELIEYESKLYPRKKISPKSIALIREKYNPQIKIILQDTRDGDYWKITAKGWVGYIPISSELAIKIFPKVSIANLFLMLEYAYNLKSFSFSDSLMNCETIEDFYNRLVKLLCQLILKKCRQGLYKSYISKKDKLNYVRGRLDITESLKQPWDIKFVCHYKEQTTDIKENQILLWTLYLISRHYLCNDINKSLIRKAFTSLSNIVKLTSFTVLDLENLQYNRLNRDYERIHILCRFFITNSMPTQNRGNNIMLPFIVNMAQLYEQFVANWLKINLPDRFELKIQKKVNLKSCNFKIDLSIEDRKTKKVIYVLDTKYKNYNKPSNPDIYQINTYAISQNCDRGILIYPQDLQTLFDEKIGDIKIKSLVFSLQNNIEQSGKYFLKTLLG